MEIEPHTSGEQPQARGERAEREGRETPAGGVGRRRTLLLCAAIFLAAAGLLAAIFSTEPVASRESATRRTAMLVELGTAEAGTFRPAIVAMGTVRPEQEVVLRPQVSGEVVARSGGFVPGGLVDEGEILVRLERADYENALRQRRSELRQARADLELEMGRQDVARREYELLGETLSGGNEALVLREPQLDVVKSRIASAEAAVAQARLDLERTVIRAPFDAHVLSREVDVGSQVAPGDPLARLVGVETYWVEATVPVSQLHWLPFPTPRAPAAPRCASATATRGRRARTGPAVSTSSSRSWTTGPAWRACWSPWTIRSPGTPRTRPRRGS